MLACRRASWPRTLGVATLACVMMAAGPVDAAQEPGGTSVERRFLQGLRERGYHDLAIEYLGQLRADPKTPDDLKAILDYEQGRGLLDEATNLSDLDRRRVLLEEARTKLDAFVAAHPDHPLVAEALVQVARLLFERGLTAGLQATEAGGAAKQARQAEARAAFADSRKAYDRAIAPLKKAYDAFPRFIPEGDPRRADRDRVHVALMDAELQRALVDYEEAQTHAAGSGQRNQLLDQARTTFQGVYNRYRTQLAGFFAHMWEAKCYEEKGELGPAMGIYKELMEHPDPALAPLKRKVMYFQIIVDGKRGDHALAVDRAAAWLQQFPGSVRSDEGIGVRFELAKNLLAQVPKLPNNDREAATRRATDLLAEVVRYYSPFKPEAIELLRKYRPSAALNANATASLSFDDAYAQAESAISTRDWERASALLQQAVRRADPKRDAERANRARYLMAYAKYEAGRFFESAVLAEHLARRYPTGGLSPRAAEVAMAAWTQAYNAPGQPDRGSDLEHLVDIARYTATTWPDSDQADAARSSLGEIALGRGRYKEAAEAFESVRPGSAGRLEAMVRAGDAHWRLAQQLRTEGKTAEGDAEAARAQALMEEALQARREAKTPASDPGLIANLNALAEIHRASGRPEDALKLLEPAAQALGDGSLSEDLAPLRTALLTIQLRSNVAAGKSQAAIDGMKRIEKTGGGGAGLTQLYFELGRSLQREIETLASRPDPASQARVEQTRKAYGDFLQALAASKEGQTFDSLMFAGNALLEIGQPGPAGAVFDRMLADYGKVTEYQPGVDGSNRLLRVRIKKVEALRKQKKFAEAQKLLDEVKPLAPRLLDPRLEQGYLLEDWARAEPTRWRQAYAHWQQLSAMLQRSPNRRLEYFDAIYHVALALQGMNQKSQAIATLKSVMTLTPTVGNPAMKAKYEALLGQLSK